MRRVGAWCGVRAERAAGAGGREPPVAVAGDGGGGAGPACRPPWRAAGGNRGCRQGADHAAHLWCQRHGLAEDRHRCHPVDWRAERRARPRQWRLAGPERNSRMLLLDRPQLIICFTTTSTPPPVGRQTWPCAAYSGRFPSGWCPAKIPPSAAAVPGPVPPPAGQQSPPGARHVFPPAADRRQGLAGLGSRPAEALLIQPARRWRSLPAAGCTLF